VTAPPPNTVSPQSDTSSQKAPLVAQDTVALPVPETSALTSPAQPPGPGPLPVINKAKGSRARRQGVRFRSFKTKGSMITDVHLYAKEN
jgi:hypothetical protein